MALRRSNAYSGYTHHGIEITSDKDVISFDHLMVISVEEFTYFIAPKDYFNYLTTRSRFYRRIYSDWERIEIFLWGNKVATLFNDTAFGDGFSAIHY